MHGSSSSQRGLSQPNCNFDLLEGREFSFPKADPVLHTYGFVLWKPQASIVAEPLSYAEHAGRRGKLTGRKVRAHGITWYEGQLDDCSLLYAEDASGHSTYPGIQHLEFNGKIVFEDMLAAGEALIGSEVIVKADGLEPRHRLYTPRRNVWYPLRDGERLRVVGTDTYRYAHAKGVGPYFLKVARQTGETGLIKFNPNYLTTAHGPLVTVAGALGGTTASLDAESAEGKPVADPLQMPSAAMVAAALPFARHRVDAFDPGLLAPVEVPEEFVLNVAAMDIEPNAISAAQDLRRAGYAATVSPQQAPERVFYRIQIEGFNTVDAALAAAEDLAQRFGWRDTWVIPR